MVGTTIDTVSNCIIIFSGSIMLQISVTDEDHINVNDLTPTLDSVLSIPSGVLSAISNACTILQENKEPLIISSSDANFDHNYTYVLLCSSILSIGHSSILSRISTTSFVALKEQCHYLIVIITV